MAWKATLVFSQWRCWGHKMGKGNASTQLYQVAAVRASLFLRTTAAILWNSTDVWHCPAWSGCTSLQACSQTSCLLVEHVPWLQAAARAICEGTGSPSRSWAAAPPGDLPDTGWHTVSSRVTGWWHQRQLRDLAVIPWYPEPWEGAWRSAVSCVNGTEMYRRQALQDGSKWERHVSPGSWGDHRIIKR